MIKKLLFLLAAVTGTSFTMNAQNLILNSNLEAGTGNTFTNWTTWGNPNLTAELIETHGGSARALKAISTGANEWSLQFITSNITTVVGTSYEVTFWIKSANGGSTMRTSVASGTDYYQSPQTIGTEWQQVTYAFTAKSQTTKVSLDLGKSTETFYIDDIEMYPLTSNNIVNGGLETGTGDVFTNWTKAGATANLTSESVEVRSGTRALKAISTGTNEWDLVMQSDAVATVIGRYYEAAIWIKSVGGASTMRLSTTGGTAEYGPATLINNTTTWQRVSLVFKATATSTKFNMDLGKSTETFYIDDASFNAAQTVALGVSDFNAENDKISFYPNPVKDYLNIDSNTAIKSITIFDLTGKTVRTIKNAENIQSVDLSGLNQGMYILSTDTNKQFKFLKN